MERDASPLVILEEIFPGDTNAYGTAFGGKILALMDRAAGLAASRFAHSNFVTVSLDALKFKAPVRQGEIAEVRAKVVYTSNHTCGVDVRVYAVDKRQWEHLPCCRGTFFMVAIGPDNQPIAVPKLNPITDHEKAQWSDARAIHQSMITNRKEAS